MRNHTSLTSFILLGLTDDTQLQILILIFLLITYMLSVTGNLSVSFLTLDSHLRTVMYFFPQNFSLLEISFTSACIPRFLCSISTGNRTITYNACICQLFFTDVFAVTEFFLLATISFDRYVAICKPLHYMTIMKYRVCKRFIFCCWMTSLLIILPPLSLGLDLEFCASNAIFACDANPMLKISCSDTWLIEQMVIVCAMMTFLMNLVCVVLCYMYIIRTILRLPSAQQTTRAFSTCSSHMIVVSITYGSCIFVYIKPSAKAEMAINKGVSILTTSISPMLNPLIYTLKNKEVKQAFNDLVKRFTLFSTN